MEYNCYFQKHFTHSYKQTIFEANTVKKGRIGQLSVFVLIFLGFTLYFMLTYMFSTQIWSNLQATLGELYALSHIFCAENVAVCLTSCTALRKTVTFHLNCVTRKKETCIFHELQRGQIYFTSKNSAADTEFKKWHRHAEHRLASVFPGLYLGWCDENHL